MEDKNISHIDIEEVKLDDFNYFNDKNLFNDKNSSHNTSISFNVKEEHYMIPNWILKELDNTQNDDDFPYSKNNNKLNINSPPFIPSKKKINNHLNTKINYCCDTHIKIINKKKKNFIVKKEDWPCYRCKNINFSFRDKCNKCHLLKEESEKQYMEVGKNILQILSKSNIKERN